MMWALIENGVVRETTDLDPAGRFHPSIVWVPCASTVKPGDLFNAGEFAAPAAAAPLSGNALILAQIAAKEATITSRRMREALLGTDGGWLHAMDSEIAALRRGLT